MAARGRGREIGPMVLVRVKIESYFKELTHCTHPRLMTTYVFRELARAFSVLEDKLFALFSASALRVGFAASEFP